MYSINNGNDLLGPTLDFPLWEVKGCWVSREGAPSVRIYRDTRYWNGGYYVEFAYDENTVFYRLIKKGIRNFRYFDLYGPVVLAYDARRDTLRLSAYGEYFRVEE